jgi:hypothetical protein
MSAMVMLHGVSWVAQLQISFRKGCCTYQNLGGNKCRIRPNGIRRIFCHQDFISNAKMIVDIRGVIKIEASFENIFWTSASIGNESSRFPCDAKVVVLVSNSTQYGFTRIVAQVLDYLYSIEVISAFNEEDVLKHRGRCEVSFAQLISD